MRHPIAVSDWLKTGVVSGLFATQSQLSMCLEGASGNPRSFN